MRLDRQLVHMLVGAIVLIAAYLVPSAAEAHAGHRHPEPAAVATAMPAKAQPAAHATALTDVEAAFSADAGDPSDPAKPRGCNGVCCNMGVACCAHALVAETGSAIPSRAAIRLGRAPDLLAHSGTDPETLPKPPRPFA